MITSSRKEKTKVYLDNCAYNRPFDDQSQIRISLESQAKLHIQRLVLDKEIVLAYSYMSLYENNDNPHEERQFSISDFFRNASLFVNYDKAEKIEAIAAEIMKYQIENKDAIHIACAIEANCDFFITTDDNLEKKFKGNEITICNPVDFVRVLEEKNE